MKNEDDQNKVFRDAVRGVRRLQQDRVLLRGRPKPRPLAAQRRRDEREVMQSLLSDEYTPAEVETGEELFFSRPGLQHSVLRKFRRGHFAMEAEIDLHGRVVAEARELVTAFLRNARLAQHRCVRIIHGKGLGTEGRVPVLKNKVNAWLRQRDDVLAFCSARPQHGGTGAVYVLLRRK